VFVLAPSVMASLGRQGDAFWQQVFRAGWQGTWGPCLGGIEEGFEAVKALVMEGSHGSLPDGAVHPFGLSVNKGS
jgi:hypothetical protein